MKVRLCLLEFEKCVRGLSLLQGEDGKSRTWNHLLHHVAEKSYFGEPNPVLVGPSCKINRGKTFYNNLYIRHATYEVHNKM